MENEERHFMNPAHGAHLGHKSSGGKEGEGKTPERSKPGEHGKHPHMAIHSHSKGHTVHITHPSGESETHEHSSGDAEGIAEHVHRNFGGAPSNESAGDEEPMQGLEGLGL